MKSIFLSVILVLTVVTAGCSEEELSACHQNNTELQTKLTESHAELGVQEKDYQQKVAKLQSQINQLEITAMESITVMMKKQGERDQKIEYAHKTKVVELENRIKDLMAENIQFKNAVAQPE